MRVAIVGAGLLGRLLAWRLLQQDFQITLYEAGDFLKPRSAAQTAAAMISPYSELLVTNKTIFAIGRQSLELWPRWIQTLNQQPGNNKPLVTYANPGTIAVAHSQDQSELQQFNRDLQSLLGQENDSVYLTRDALLSREAELFQFQHGLYLPDEAYLDNRQLLQNLFVTIKQLHGKCIDHTPLDTLASQDNSAVLSEFDCIIDCRGFGAKKDLPGLRGVRGEVMWVHCPEVQFQHAVRLLHPRYKLYLVPKPNHHYIIGATEIESEDLSPLSVQSNLELASALYSIHPAFAEARIIETDVNLRPAFVDNEPKVIVDNNIIHLNGLHRHGFLLAPTLVEDVIKYLSDREPSRFWRYFLQ